MCVYALPVVKVKLQSRRELKGLGVPANYTECGKRFVLLGRVLAPISKCDTKFGKILLSQNTSSERVIDLKNSNLFFRLLGMVNSGSCRRADIEAGAEVLPTSSALLLH